MKLKKIVIALGLAATVASSPAFAAKEESASDYALDAIIIGGLTASAGPAGAVLGVGAVGYMNGWFENLGFADKQWIDDVALDSKMPSGFSDTAYIIKDFANRCEAAGKKPLMWRQVATVNDWNNAMKGAQEQINRLEGNGWQVKQSTSFDDSSYKTRVQAGVVLRGSTHIGVSCMDQVMAGSRTINTVDATLEVWVSKKDGKYHKQEFLGEGVADNQVVEVSEAIEAGRNFKNQKAQDEKKFD